MNFIKKKNLQEGEELLYVPELHWAYVAKHMLPYMLPLLLLALLWRFMANVVTTFGIAFLTTQVVKFAFSGTLLIVLVICVLRIISYLNTEYGVTNKRLIMKKGLFFLRVREISIDRIESIYCYRGLFGKIFRYGTIRIGGVGGKVPRFHMVHRPFALRRKIVDILERNKTITVVHGDLPKPLPPLPIAKPEPEAEPIYRYGTFVRVLPG